MLEILLVFVVFVFIVSIVFELATFCVYGSFIPDKLVNEALDTHLSKGISVNPYDNSIVTIGELPYISKVPNGILGSYYIDDVGRISRFSSGHKRIDSIYKNLKYEGFSKEDYIKRKLKLNK